MHFLHKQFQPIKYMFVYAASILLTKGMSLIMLPVISSYFTPTQLGKLELIATTSTFLCLLSGFAMQENLYRFVGYKKNQKRDLKKLIKFILIHLPYQLLWLC
ncbi:hypothetical protein [Candidatus Photodesmus anomalopis]|uniref:hypothetical protein n=1 Tax=Candidatus Photodesmus anomalopis TaxID=28176 RepID=UPI0006874269|nr:hypothetical protein [Candidatus Photodesmus katoptron]